MNLADISIVIPSKNESVSLQSLLPNLVKLNFREVIVVDDGSTDDTESICDQNNVIRIFHPYSKGNGAAIKSGASYASGEAIVFMDADGQHRVEDIPKLLETYKKGFAMVVGARDRKSQASVGRLMANTLYNKLASWMVGQNIVDLTSGFRMVNTKKFLQFLDLLPNGFSYPTTSTMAFFRAGYSVAFTPIVADKRIGKSHINLKKDGIRFFLIIFKIGTLYSPLKIFTPISLSFFLLGVSYYVYTFLTEQRFTNMSALLLSTSILVFLMGLISEQITVLMYSRKK